jgi:hypothetical protein
LGFSRQGNFKANEGRCHPDRDAQFEHINSQVLAFQAAEQPVISVDILTLRENPKIHPRRHSRERACEGIGIGVEL